MDKIIIVGAFSEVIELALELKFEIKGFFDKNKNLNAGFPVLADDDEAIAEYYKYNSSKLFLSPDNPKLRENLFLKYNKAGFAFIGLHSHLANVSKSAKIEQGVLVQAFVNISSACKIGSFVRLNVGCNIMHDSIIGAFSTIAPNAVILGNVAIGKRCYIGANATVLPGKKICDDAIIGAGSVVTKNISEKGTYAGIPARLLKQ